MNMESGNVALVASRIKASSVTRRIVSIIIPLPLLLVVVYLSVWSVALIVILAVMICLIELYKGLKQAGYHPRSEVGMITALFLCAAALFQHYTSLNLVGLALSGGVILTLTNELTRKDSEHGLASWALSFVSACYVGWLLSYYILIRVLETPLEGGWLAFLKMDPGAAWIYFILAITWLQDAGAYFIGRSWGRHKLAPIVSPGKTWEGAIGGIATAIVAAMICILILGLPISYSVAAFLGLIGGIVGLIGDLAESLIKRRIGIKDMGNVIPGHGGILDRVDSIMFTAPIIYYLILLLV